MIIINTFIFEKRHIEYKIRIIESFAFYLKPLQISYSHFGSNISSQTFFTCCKLFDMIFEQLSYETSSLHAFNMIMPCRMRKEYQKKRKIVIRHVLLF